MELALIVDNSGMGKADEEGLFVHLPRHLGSLMFLPLLQVGRVGRGSLFTKAGAACCQQEQHSRTPQL